DAHSKEDDDRDRTEVDRFAQRDPLNVFLARSAGNPAVDAECAAIRVRVDRAVELASQERAAVAADPAADRSTGAPRKVEFSSESQLSALNRALFQWLSGNARAIVLGEDVRAPYGGAFKVTRDLSNSFPDRVLNCPI